MALFAFPKAGLNILQNLRSVNHPCRLGGVHSVVRSIEGYLRGILHSLGCVMGELGVAVQGQSHAFTAKFRILTAVKTPVQNPSTPISM
ncbi:hypothetical protein [Shinella zoogloeoides]|uniref:hypothetical protein n=1 Tax=Shinella zoogloeoides TaxID=352475 RepID=UPI0028ACEC5E|nr:hypothetical protein [Shinella zoogloeoides]